MSTQRVVTYGHAYLSGRTIDLCDRHSDSAHPTVARIYGPLDEAKHGAHAGHCEACDDEARMSVTVEA